MSVSSREAIDFAMLESQKENIEPIRQGRSVVSLAKAFGNDPIQNVAELEQVRSGFEDELKTSADLDDPLEVWVRYLSWIKAAYPSGQSAQNNYIQLLERCSKQFMRMPHYANDPRYLRIWIEYARFSDDPREMFCFLARNEIGQELATFYEEYAAFLEVRDRKGQADEIYQMGLIRGARPINRLKRKYDEFTQRLAANPPARDEPSSPPIAPVRAALTTKFGGLAEAQQHAPQNSNKQKLQIFTDENEPAVSENIGTRGWGSIGTLQSRKKENTVETKRMFGEKLPQHISTQGIEKLEVFKDDPTVQIKAVEPAKKAERVVCDLEAVYSVSGYEFSFEELKAKSMGILNKKWQDLPLEESLPAAIAQDTYVSVMDTESPLKDSPKRRSMKRSVASPTINTRAATDAVLDIFSQPLKCEQSDDSSDSDSEDDDPDNTFSAVQHDAIWTTKTGTHSTAGPDYQSDYIEDDHPEKLENDAYHEAVLEDPLISLPELPLPASPSRMMQSEEEKGTRSALVPVTPQQSHALPHRVNGFDLMTPITEDTENLQISAMPKLPMAILVETEADDEDEDADDAMPDELYSSPFIEHPPPRAPASNPSPLRPALAEQMKNRSNISQHKKREAPSCPVKGPLVSELCCNPMDISIRETICSQLFPQISTYEGSHVTEQTSYAKKFEAIERYIRALNKKGGEATQHLEVILDFTSRYAIKKKLGEGAFAPVFLIENISGATGPSRAKLEAMKIEKPASAWEFFIMRQVHRRLGVSRAVQSVALAHEYYEFSDCSFLILDYRDQGTILDLVNMCRTEAGGVDELLAIFLTVELLRTIEALHSRGLMHGDLKSDNCLLRFTDVKDNEWSSLYQRDGSDQWEKKGITLIDFGRGVDMKHFDPNVQFIADWRTDEQDCVEMRDARPWTYQIDYHGLACIAHSLLFGKYIETVAAGGLGVGKKRYALKNSFKRYWKQELWEPLFDLLLNPTTYGTLPVTDSLRTCRERMELYLEQHGSAGLGLKGLIRKVEIDLAMARKRQ